MAVTLVDKLIGFMLRMIEWLLVIIYPNGTVMSQVKI